MATQHDHDIDADPSIPDRSVHSNETESEVAEPGDDADIDQIQADIDRTREQLGQTVEALSHKLDVKAQAGERVAHARTWAADQVERGRQATTDDNGKPLPAIRIGAPATLGAIAVIIGLLVWRRSR